MGRFGRWQVLLTASGRVWAAGSNTLGQCGLGPLPYTRGWIQVAVPTAVRWTQVACGMHHTCLLGTTVLGDTCLATTGWGADGQLGVPPRLPTLRFGRLTPSDAGR
jgi:alpha-tubulin suppressor-like RCC1 family protein